MTFDKTPHDQIDPPTNSDVDDRSPRPDRVIIRAKDFRKVFGIPDSTRNNMENPKSRYFDPTFPKKIDLGLRSVGYFLDEVLAWLEGRRKK